MRLFWFEALGKCTVFFSCMGYSAPDICALSCKYKYRSCEAMAARDIRLAQSAAHIIDVFLLLMICRVAYAACKPQI